MDIFFLDLVQEYKWSEHVDTMCVGMPGAVAIWKYNFVRAMRLSFGMGYLSMLQLYTEVSPVHV